MIKKLSVLFLALAFISAAFAQEVVKQKAPIRTDDGTTAYQSYLPLGNNSPLTAANYVAVDTMANAFGPASNTLNPLAFDIYSNVLAVVHRGNSSYAVGSGEMWWNYSTDMGTSWHRSNTSVQNGTLAQNVGRYPSMTIANYTHSTNMANLLGAFSWPELNPAAFGWLGYGVSEGLLESAFANIEQGPPAYGSNVPTFSDDSWIYWYSDNQVDNSLRLWRTQDYSTVEVIDPPTWGTTRWTNGNILLGGVSHNGVVYVGAIGSYTEEIGAGGWEIGYSKSTDNGATWSDWFVPDWRTISGLTNFTELWDWKLADAFVSYSGDIQVDANGNVHLVTGLTDSVTATNAIVEIYETAPNVWAGKVITAAHDKSKYGYEANTPGLGQTGPSIMIASNQARDFFAVQYTIGSPETQDSLCDLYVHTRALSDANWSGSTNLTETNAMNEDGCHLAPYMANSGGSDYIFSMFWYEQGNTTPIIVQTNPAVIFVAPYAVRSAGADIPVTFQVDMGVQAFEGNFPAGANVVARGDFQMAFGDTANWYGNMFQLSDVDGDTIYTGTFNVPAALAGNTYNFKYVIVAPPAGDNWESTANRPLTVTAPSTTLPVVCFNDDCIWTPINSVTNTLNFTADISGILGVGVGGAFDPAQDSLTVQGLDWDNLGKNVVGNRKLTNTDPFNSGIYTTTLTVTSGSAAPNGVGDSTKWKYRAFPDTRFANTGWETGNDRWHFYVTDGSVVDLPVIVPRIYPLFGPLANDVPMEFNVDMTDAVNNWNGLPIPLAELQFVGIKGAAPFLGSWGGNWTVADTIGGDASTLKVMHNVGGNNWRYSVIVAAGTNSGAYEYKYAAMYPGADTIHGGSTPLDNEMGFGSNHLFILSDVPTGIVLNDRFGVVSVKEIQDLVPVVYELGQNYPNPFNPSTTIRFSIPEAGVVTLRVFNLLGEEVAALLNGDQTAGVYEATFDASKLSSGIYFYTLESKNFTSTKKMVLLK